MDRVKITLSKYCNNNGSIKLSKFYTAAIIINITMACAIFILGLGCSNILMKLQNDYDVVLCITSKFITNFCIHWPYSRIFSKSNGVLLTDIINT